MRFTLSDEDRERLGAPEWLEVQDNFALSTKDAEALEVAGGDWTLYGSTKIGGVRALVWVGLHRVGVTVPFDELDFNLGGFRMEREPGKAVSSGRSASTTPSPSAPSGRRTPRKRSQS